MRKYLHKTYPAFMLVLLFLNVGIQQALAQSNTFRITATAGPNGKISPAGTTIVGFGGGQDYIITPDPLYAVADISIDGVSIGAQGEYDFQNVTGNHTISVTFYALFLNITASAGPGGQISPSGVSTIPSGTGIGYTITPNAGYAVADVYIDGESIGAQETYEFSAVFENHTISVTFYQTLFTITASAGPHGSISPPGVFTVPISSGVGYTITPDPGYSVADVTIDGVSAGAVTTYNFSLVFDNHTINVTFSPNIYTITASAGLHGSIGPVGTTQVSGGSDQPFAITPDPGYQVGDLIVDGISDGPVQIGLFTFPAVISNHTISVTFTPKIFTITANAGPHGSIGPVGTTQVSGGSDQSFIITPDPGYLVADLIVDGISDGPVQIGLFTFPAVISNHTISVTFTPKIFTITANAGPHGSIGPVGTTQVSGGSDQPFAITPDPGYQVGDLIVDGISDGPVQIGLFIFPAVISNHTISVTFTPKIFTITASAGPHGSIGPLGTTQVNGGSDQSYVITPDPGYKIGDLIVDGISNGAVQVGLFTFPAVIASHTISVTFYPDISLTIKASAGANGSISPAGSTLVGYGNSKTYSITPAAGYHVAVLKVDGLSLSPSTNYTFTNVTANHTISATFALTTYTITSSAGAGGTISPAGSVTVSPGGSKTYTIKPSAGYNVSDVTLDGVSLGTVKQYVFTNVSANHLIIANFAPVTYVITSSASANGIITPSGPTTVSYGANQGYTFTPDAGYSITKLLVDNKSVAIAPSYTFSNVTAAHTISVTFSCPKPAAPVLSGPVAVTKQQDNLVYTVTNAVAGVSYNWTVPSSVLIKSGQGTSSITVTWGKASGNVSCVASTSCSSSVKTTYAVTVVVTAAMSDVQPEIQTIPGLSGAALEAYPNPAQDNVRVRFSLANASKCTIRLMDQAGRVVKIMEVEAVKGFNETNLDLSRIAGGTYFVSLVHGQEIKTILLVRAQ